MPSSKTPTLETILSDMPPTISAIKGTAPTNKVATAKPAGSNKIALSFNRNIQRPRRPRPRKSRAPAFHDGGS